MLCQCGARKGHAQHVQMGGVLLLLIGLVYVAKSLGWIAANLPDFWALLLLVFGLFAVMCAKCFEG